MNKLAIKEALRKAKWANKRETGKRYLTKGQMHQVLEGVTSLNIPREEKGFNEHGIKSIGEILGTIGK